MCNIQPYCLLNHQILYTTVILVIQKIDSYCACTVQRSLLHAYLISFRLSAHFQLLMVPAHIPISLPVEKSTVSLVNNAVFICNESLFFVSVVATIAFNQSTRHGCYTVYVLGAIKYGLSNNYGKILVMLVYGASIRGI